MGDYLFAIQCADGNNYIKVNEESHLVADVPFQEAAKFKIIAEQGYEYLFCMDNNKFVQQGEQSDADIEATGTTVNQFSTFKIKTIPGQASYHAIVSENGHLWQTDSSDQHVRANGNPSTVQNNKSCWFEKVAVVTH